MIGIMTSVFLFGDFSGFGFRYLKMPNLDALNLARKHLKTTKTRVTKEDGSILEEQRSQDGNFDVVFEADGTGNDQTPFKHSNRQLRSLRREHALGFVIDLTPDLQVAEVADRLYLSSQDVAQDCELMQGHGITHIVNAATGVRCFYKDKFAYLKLDVLDYPGHDIKQHFPETNKFIHQAIEEGGNVLVHCNAGISRSTTIVIAYLMWSRELRAKDVLAEVKLHRPIAQPNVGFMRQLEEYEEELKQK